MVAGWLLPRRKIAHAMESGAAMVDSTGGQAGRIDRSILPGRAWYEQADTHLSATAHLAIRAGRPFQVESRQAHK